MTEMPRDSNNYDARRIPIESVRPGYSLAVDRGHGLQLFQVDEVSFRHSKDSEGNPVTAFVLTSGPLAGGGDPWVLQYPAGTSVLRLLRPSGTSSFAGDQIARTSYYAIIEHDQDGRIAYLPPLATNEAAGFVYRMTPDRSLAWRFADKHAAEEYADVLNAQNPGRHLEVIDLPA